jgi:hypothetical protein
MEIPYEYPIFQFLYALVNTPGLGGIAVFLIASGSISMYAAALRWIHQGGKEDEKDVYSYPTPALHHQSSD